MAILISTASVVKAEYNFVHVIKVGNSFSLVNKVFCSAQLSFCMGVQNCMKQVKFVWLLNKILKCYPLKICFIWHIALITFLFMLPGVSLF